MNLRPYQQSAVAGILAEWAKGVRSTLLVLPTGTGKTVTFAEIARLRMEHGRTLVLAHREELIWQAAEKLHAVTGVRPEIEMADNKAGHFPGLCSPFVVSTIQTQIAGRVNAKRYNVFDPSQFGTLIIDEAHHSASNAYREIVAHYGQNPDLCVLGVTATPDRGDGRALGSVFDSVAFDYEIPDAIRDGWLVPIHQQMVKVEGLDFSGLRTIAGDFDKRSLEELLTYEKRLHAVAVPAFEIAGNRKTLIFCVSVVHAERLAEILNRMEPGCADWVCGKTDKDKRRGILRRFKDGRPRFLCNVGVLTEGFDDPCVEVVVMARPTKSRALYAQCIGRGTRPLPGVVDGPELPEQRRDAIKASAKPACLVVDLAGNAGKHRLVTTADILGGRYSEEVRVRAAKRAAKRGGEGDVEEDLLLAEQEIEKERILAESRRRAMAQKRNALKATASYKAFAVDPFTSGLVPNVNAGGSDDPPTEGQAQILRGIGMDPRTMTRAEAAAMCREVMRRRQKNLCSLRQAALLKRYGLDTEVSHAAASALIDSIKQNGWKAPADGAAKAIAVGAAPRPMVRF